MTRSVDIVIAGAGMVGLTIASLITRGADAGGINLHVVDAGSEPRFDTSDDVGLRVSAISPGSAAVFEKIGIWSRVVATRACPYRAMRVWDAEGSVEGPETLRFDAADFAVAELGFIVENALIQDLLLQELRRSQIEVTFETPITALRPGSDGVVVELADGRRIDADLVVGADGANSSVRRFAGIEVRSWQYAQAAFVTHLKPELGHGNTAWQRFLRSGPIALLPLADGRVSVVWSTTPEQAERAMAADDVRLGSQLADASGHVLGALEVAGPRGSFPLRAQHAPSYVRQGLALAGDAAHSVHPLAGQGANLGIADAESLVGVLEAALDRGEFPGDLPVLRRYERRRKGANQAMLHFVDLLNRLFASEQAVASRLRGAGMRLFNASGPIRQRAVQVALGLEN